MFFLKVDFRQRAQETVALRTGRVFRITIASGKDRQESVETKANEVTYVCDGSVVQSAQSSYSGAWIVQRTVPKGLRNM